MRDTQLRGGRLDLDLKDLKRALIGARFAPPEYYLKSDHPVALSSNDHRIPRGTINDDTRWPRFCKKAERIFEGRRIRFLDIGCAGGGLVFDFLVRGHDAVGIEGSDINWLTERAHWGVIPDILVAAKGVSGGYAPLAVLTAQQRIELLTPRGEDPFFRLVKGMTVDGYYTSQEGLAGELGWHGNTFLSEFKGCTHPEHQR